MQAKYPRLFVRVGASEKARLKKAAGANLSAFLLRSASDAIRYRRLLDQARAMAATGIKTSAMRVTT